MRRAGTVAVALLSLALLSGSAGAFSYAEWQFGDPIPPIDGRSLAMGGAGMASADGARGIALNPALVGKTIGIDVAATAYGIAAEEARDVPLHDSFDGVIADNTYALNTGFYDHYMASVAWRPQLGFLDATMVPAVAIGYRPRLDMNYTYHVQYRDPDTQTVPNDKILYDYYAEGQGGVNAYTVAIGQQVVDGVYLGLGVDFLRGEFDTRERWVYPPDATDEDADSWAEFNDASGTQFTVGLLVERFHRVDVAVVYRSAFELDTSDHRARAAGADSVTYGEFEYRYPDAIAIGFEYHPRNLIMTTVNLDIEYTRWSDFTSKWTWAPPPGIDWWPTPGEAPAPAVYDPEFDDTVVYRVGVEHGFADDTQARFGFVYEPSYVDSRMARTGFCAGVGMDLLGLRLDVGGELTLREYSLDDGRIRETTTQVMATLVHAF
jgi:hypothetical protein